MLSLMCKCLNLRYNLTEELFLIPFLKIHCCQRVRRISVLYQMGSEDGRESFLGIYLLIPMSIISLNRSQLALTLLVGNLTCQLLLSTQNDENRPNQHVQNLKVLLAKDLT